MAIWEYETVRCFSLSKDKPERPGWILQRPGRTWWIFKAVNPTLGLYFILTTSRHDHFSDHATLQQAKDYAQQGGHIFDPQAYENRRKGLRR